MLDKKKINSLIFILFSNGLTMIAGILAGFIVPKLMTITGYGYYKIYGLYLNYFPLFHFGLSTGIYLRYGDKSYDELDRSYFRFYFRLLFATQLFFSLVLVFWGLNYAPKDYTFIIISLAVVLLSGNITNYFQLISQITERYHEYSIRNIIQSVLNIFVILLFWGINRGKDFSLDYKVYLFSVVIIQVILTLWYIWTYREIVVGKINNKPTFQHVFDIYKTGFVLILAGLVAQLVLTIDRQFVSMLFSTENYAIYAFAYSLLAFIMTFINAISTVVYPTIKRLSSNGLKEAYSKAIEILSIMSIGLISSYFALNIIISFLLPKYIGSLPYLAVILPTMVISSLINVIIHNYFKILDKEKAFFSISVIILVISALANWFAYRIHGSMIAISVASVFCLSLWYILTQIYLYGIFRFKYLKNNIYVLTMIAIFYILVLTIDNIYISFGIYLILWILLTITLYFNDIKQLISSARKRK